MLGKTKDSSVSYISEVIALLSGRISSFSRRIRRSYKFRVLKRKILSLCDSLKRETAELASWKEITKYISNNGRRAYYVGWIGRGNLGDELLYNAFKEMFSDSVYFYAKKNESRIGDIISRIFMPNVVFLGGGTLIGFDVYLNNIRKAIKANPGAKYIIFGTGVEDVELWKLFNYDLDIDPWRLNIEKADYVSVRGPISKSDLHKWGIKREVPVIGDPAIWFSRSKIMPKKRMKLIGINFGPSRGNIYGQDEKEVLAFCAALLSLLKERGWNIKLFPMITDDVEYLREAVRMAGIGCIPMHTSFLDINGTMNALEEQDVFIGEKLHSVVLASCVYTPAIMLAYRTKCIDFMQSINRNDWCYKTDQLDCNLIYERLVDLYENAAFHQTCIFDAMQKRKASITAAVNHVNSIIH